jgi:predicted GIY-YIG superfamily endonuclease
MSYESNKYCNGNLYVGIAKDVKNQQLFTYLYAGITMDVKKISYYL